MIDQGCRERPKTTRLLRLDGLKLIKKAIWMRTGSISFDCLVALSGTLTVLHPGSIPPNHWDPTQTFRHVL
jgi:hypothetical protein